MNDDCVACYSLNPSTQLLSRLHSIPFRMCVQCTMSSQSSAAVAVDNTAKVCSDSEPNPGKFQHECNRCGFKGQYFSHFGFLNVEPPHEWHAPHVATKDEQAMLVCVKCCSILHKEEYYTKVDEQTRLSSKFQNASKCSKQGIRMAPSQLRRRQYPQQKTCSTRVQTGCEQLIMI